MPPSTVEKRCQWHYVTGSVCPLLLESVHFKTLWTPYLKNQWREFHPIVVTDVLGLTDVLIRFWGQRSRSQQAEAWPSTAEFQLVIHKITITCCRRHVVGQQLVSKISVVSTVLVEIFVACLLNVTILISYYGSSLLYYLEHLFCFTFNNIAWPTTWQFVPGDQICSALLCHFLVAVTSLLVAVFNITMVLINNVVLLWPIIIHGKRCHFCDEFQYLLWH